MIRATLLITIFALCACSSSSAGKDDTGMGGDGGPPTDVGVQADGPRADGPVGDLPPAKKDTGPKPPKVTWTVAGEQKDVAWSNGRLALHPTQAKTLAVRLEVSTFDPDVVVATSSDLGKSIQKVTVKAFKNPGPGHYDTHLGFAYDPTNGGNLALLTQLPSSNPRGPDDDSVVFATSKSGGAGFTVAQLQTNPWPPDGMQLIPGPKTRIAVRAQHVLYISDDLSRPLKSVFDDSKQCLDHGDFAVRPKDALKDSVFNNGL